MAYFTKENARQFSANGNQKRWEAYRQAIARGENPRKPKQVEPAPEPEPAAIIPKEDDKFPSCRLGRVRKHLGRVDNMLDHETDPQKIDRLASASARLSEIERILAGRPLPGSHRPKSVGNSKRAQVAEPVHE